MSEPVAIIHTSKGNIRLKLHAKKTPRTVANFVNLAQKGFYKKNQFHRVINNFMIQGGCPEGSGRGGPGYRFPDEFHPELRHDRSGILSMANAGPGTNGSQFFITHGPTPHLDDHHTVFGEVVGEADQEVVNAIRQGDQIEDITIEGNTAPLFDQVADELEKWNKALK